MKIYYVYGLRAEDETTPFYIGKSFVGSKRLYQHERYSENSERPSALYSKLKSLKTKNVSIVEDILATTPEESNAFLIERALIKLYGRKDNGTGILCNHTDGGEGASGTACPETTKLAVAEANKRRIWSDEARAMQAAKTRGRVLSAESKAKLSKSKLRPVDMFDLNGNLLRSFNSVGETAKELQTHRTYISYVLNGTKDHWNNYVFKYGVKHG